MQEGNVKGPFKRVKFEAAMSTLSFSLKVNWFFNLKCQDHVVNSRKGLGNGQF